MKGITVFVLPNSSEIRLEGVSKVQQGDEVLIEDERFGNELRKCSDVTHQFSRDGNRMKYIQRIFLI